MKMGKRFERRVSWRAIGILTTGLGLVLAIALSVYRPATRVSYTTARPGTIWFTTARDFYLHLDGVDRAWFVGWQIEAESFITLYDVSHSACWLSHRGQRLGFELARDGQQAIIWDDGQVSGDTDLLPEVLFQSENEQDRVSLSCINGEGLFATLYGHSITLTGEESGYSIELRNDPGHHGEMRTQFPQGQNVPRTIALTMTSLGSEYPANGYFEASVETFFLHVRPEHEGGRCTVMLTTAEGGTTSWEADELLVRGQGGGVIRGSPLRPTLFVHVDVLPRADGGTEVLEAYYDTWISEFIAKDQQGDLAVGREHFQLETVDTLEVANIIEIESPQLLTAVKSRTSESEPFCNLEFSTDEESGTQLSMEGKSSSVRLNGETLVQTSWEAIPEFIRVSILAVLTALFTTLVKDTIAKSKAK